MEVNGEPTWDLSHYGTPTAASLIYGILPDGDESDFADLPEPLRVLLIRTPSDQSAFRLLHYFEHADRWRQIRIDPQALAEDASQLVVPVRTAVSGHWRVDRSGNPYGDVVFPLSANCRTEYLTLARLYDAGRPTGYFIGQSQETGIYYWAVHPSVAS